jgi:ferredoxin
MKINRKIIEIDPELCDGCGQCVPSCAEGAIQIVDGKGRLVAEKYCDGLGACLGECPTGALKIIEREAEDFDEHAVEEHLKALEKEGIAPPGPAFTCPSARVQSFESEV